MCESCVAVSVHVSPTFVGRWTECPNDHVLFLSLDPELKEQLVEVIEKLLKDHTTVRYQQ